MITLPYQFDTTERWQRIVKMVLTICGILLLAMAGGLASGKFGGTIGVALALGILSWIAPRLDAAANPPPHFHGRRVSRTFATRRTASLISPSPLGNVCNTCEFFFERLSGATHSPSAEQLGAARADGQPSMERSWIEALGALLPTGDYVPFYTRPPVKLVRPCAPGDYFADEQVSTWGVDAFWRLPHEPRTEYYRARVMPLSPLKIGNRAIFLSWAATHTLIWTTDQRAREQQQRAPLA